MKRQIYDLTDQPFIMFSDRLEKVLTDASVPHNIVGGIASQAHILKMMSDHYGKNISDIINDPDIRVQDYIRSTDDIDLSLYLEGEDPEKIRFINQDILPNLPHWDVSPDGESIIEFKESRRGASRPVYRVYVDGEGSQDDVIALNISRGQKKDLHNLDFSLYNRFIDEGVVLNIPYSQDYSLKLKVPRLVHVLATKIANNRSKDLMDNRNLACLSKRTGREIDFKELSNILSQEHERKLNNFLYSEFPERVK